MHTTAGMYVVILSRQSQAPTNVAMQWHLTRHMASTPSFDVHTRLCKTFNYIN